MRRFVFWNVSLLQEGVGTPAICRWSISEAVLGLQWFIVGIVHHIEIAHLVLVCRSAIEIKAIQNKIN